MAETVWSGFLRLSLVSCPVRLAPATREPAALRLEPFDADAAPDGRAAETPAGPDDIIDVAHFCPAGQIDRARFAGSYYLYPDGPLAADTLASLRLAMQRTATDAVAHLRLGEHARPALIALHGAGLLLTTLRPPLRFEPAEFADRPDSAIPPEMVDIAEGIIRRRMLEVDANLLPDRLDAGFEPDAAEAAAIAEPPAATPQEEHDQGCDRGAEILLRMIGLGDRRFIEPGWAGVPGSRRQIEAISIRGRDALEHNAIEYRAFAPGGRATSWVGDGNYAGTHDRQVPLTGFAVRPVPELGDRIDIVYEGCFFDGGVVGPKMNGETCTSPIDDDPLEAVRISIIERPAPGEAAAPQS